MPTAEDCRQEQRVCSMKPDRRFLPVLYPRTAATLAHCTERDILDAIATGDLPASKFFEEVTKVTPADLEAWVLRRRAGGVQ
jgi:hypothetical protein